MAAAREINICPHIKAVICADTPAAGTIQIIRANCADCGQVKWEEVTLSEPRSRRGFGMRSGEELT